MRTRLYDEYGKKNLSFANYGKKNLTFFDSSNRVKTRQVILNNFSRAVLIVVKVNFLTEIFLHAYKTLLVTVLTLKYFTQSVLKW